MGEWKSRWGVVTKLSPAADCLHLQLYRDPKDRFKKGQTKASLSLQHFLGFESGFTLDKESNTIAIICEDLIVVLAFETRERLIAWQVKVGSQLGSSKEFLVMIGGGSKKLPVGPARLHLQGRKFAMTSGVPPRLLGLWKLAHLRRYGVVEGRFCFEGGSHCGKGEGLHMLITDQAQDIAEAFDAAAHGNQTPRTPAPSRKSTGNHRSQTRLSDNTDQSLPESACDYEENFFGDDSSGISPYWPSDERDFDEQEYHVKSDNDVVTKPPWNGADHVTLERCSNCLTKLGVASQSSTVPLTPNAQFNPAWTMELMEEKGPEKGPEKAPTSSEYLTPKAMKKQFEACQCVNEGPQRPPKPAWYESMKPPALLPQEIPAEHSVTNLRIGPYENYDVPKTSYTEVESTKYYDTPKRIKQVLADDLFQVKKNSTPGTFVLQKKCGCILKFGSNKKTVVVECDDNLQTTDCPCQKVTNWANNLIGLPYCKRSPNTEKTYTDVSTLQNSEEKALYATVDVSRKPKRHSNAGLEKEQTITNYENFESTTSNYENLEFALSLEYYENAKGLLKRAGVTQSELDALSTNAEIATSTLPKQVLCRRCTHSNNPSLKNKSDEYLLMAPPKDAKQDKCQAVVPGYTSMTPKINWSQSLKHPCNKLCKTDFEKSLSIPSLNDNLQSNIVQHRSSQVSTDNNPQQRSNSVDSVKLLEGLIEIDSSISSQATSSSLETLRNLALDRRFSSPSENEHECYDCCKSLGSEKKTSEESSAKDVPHLRNKLIDNAQIKRSSSVPCKSGGNRDSSSSNDSGVSSCSMKHSRKEFNEFELPSRLHSNTSRQNILLFKKMRGKPSNCVHLSLPRKSKSSDLNNVTMKLHNECNIHAKSSSAEAEVPVLPPKQLKCVMDTHSTSSGTSDMSDYIETLSLTSSHSSSDTQGSLRINRQPTSTLRPRSGKEYHNLDPLLTSMYKSGKELANYINLP